jgi:hypothetical protein
MSWMMDVLNDAERCNKKAIQTNVKGNKTFDTLPKFTAKDTSIPPAFSHIDNHRQTVYQHVAAEIIRNTK